MITKKQYPRNLQSVFVPVNYSYQTDLAYESNFRFKYTLQDIDGLFFEGLTVPLENNLSYNSPNEILKSKTEFNFNPSINVIENIPNNCVVYQESVVEDIDGGDSEGWFVKTALRYSDPKFNPYNYLLNDDASRDFLVNMPELHNIRLTDDFTFRTYNGYLDVNDSGNAGLCYQYKMRIYMDKSRQHLMNSMVVESIPNPYYGSAASSLYSPSVTGDNFNIELPVGVNNWNGQKFILRGVYNTSDTYIDANQQLTTVNINDNGYITIYIQGVAIYDGYIDNYDFWMYRWPFGTNGQVSKKHNFKVIEDCQFDAINVAWENTLGGVDYYLFTKANEKTIQTNKEIYKQNLHTLNLTTGVVSKNDFNKGVNVYRNVVDTMYEMQTDWLNQAEIDGLEDLFHSTEVYANINGEWIYVISVEKKATIYNKKRKGLKKYKLNFQIGEQNVRY